VTGLSRKLLDKDLATVVQEALADDFTNNEGLHIKADITILSSWYEGDIQRVALVQFRGRVPQSLHELRVDPLGDWQAETGDDDINFDCHFFGLTQRYALDGNEPVLAE
jgi:hypothetical protein